MSADRAPDSAAPRRTHRLRTASAVVLVLLVTVALPLSARTLNFIDVGGAPLGFLIASQGSIVVLVLIGWLFGRSAHRP